MRERLVPVIGAAGNVGKGITEAFRGEGWKISSIDPQINKAIEDLDDGEFENLFASASIAIYAADCGNREKYTENPSLERENNERFADFCQRVVKINPGLTVWYIGGSWTKRKPDKNWVVNDGSPNKDLKECNSYEKAKISAERNAQKLSSLIKIRFLDWASTVPNLAPNFSISRMIAQALEENKIRYSFGHYGRPLIESVQAGEALIVLIKNDDSGQRFTRYLIPATFVTFSSFARAVKDVVEKETGKEVALEEIKETPDFLKSQCLSDHLTGLGFVVDERRTDGALKRNAEEAFKRIKTESGM